MNESNTINKTNETDLLPASSLPSPSERCSTGVAVSAGPGNTLSPAASNHQDAAVHQSPMHATRSLAGDRPPSSRMPSPHPSTWRRTIALQNLLPAHPPWVSAAPSNYRYTPNVSAITIRSSNRARALASAARRVRRQTADLPRQGLGIPRRHQQTLHAAAGPTQQDQALITSRSASCKTLT